MNRLTFIFVCLAAAALRPQHAEPQTRTQIIIIANPALRAISASRGDIREVFNGGASTINGHPVIPVLLRSGPTTDEFLAAYLDETNASFRIQWRTLVFSGQATMPRSLDSETAIVDYIAHNPGAIGYITRSTPHESVKVLATR